MVPTYFRQGKYAEAEALHKKAMNIHQRFLGDEHPSILNRPGSISSSPPQRYVGNWTANLGRSKSGHVCCLQRPRSARDLRNPFSL